MMQLSIIVPIYNVEKYIRPCIESIFKQGLDEACFEVIIVNDGSTDRSMEMIQDIIEAHHNITVINQENQGLSVARNNGITASKGEYILMPDSDDLVVENSLPPLVKKALETKVDLVVADYIKYTNEEIINYHNTQHNKGIFNYQEKTGEALLIEDLNPRECYVWHVLFRREFLIMENIKFFPGLFYQDVIFTHECCIKAKRCIKTSWILNIYRKDREGSATYSYSIKKAKDFCIVISKTWNLISTPNISQTVKNKIRNDVFCSFTALVYSTSHDIKDPNERIIIIDYLRELIPDLHFCNGTKQVLISYIYQVMPHALIRFRRIYARVIEDRIIPFLRLLSIKVL